MWHFWLAVVGTIFFFSWLRAFKNTSTRRICILVLGDIGRSPRMQYHALSCAKNGIEVDLIGFGGSKPITELQEKETVHIHTLSELPKVLHKLPRLLYYVLKTNMQFLQLFLRLLVSASRCSHILIQNPPAIPSLGAAWIVCFLSGSKLMIDWHNYGFTILSLTLRNTKHPIIKLAKWYEQFFGRRSSHNLCVTQAMKNDLKQHWGIRATTLYDRPPARFHKTDIGSQHKLFLKLAAEEASFANSESPAGFTSREIRSTTAFTVQTTDGVIHPRTDRPALVVSSTSWTADEDFSVLLRAMEEYEWNVENGDGSLPAIVCAITGKGPLKDFYKSLIAKRKMKYVQVCTLWLEPDDYPTLLGSADLGVSLHKSSSGLDLPMKVVDMFGCGLPVCAINFDCLDELVKHKENGLIFNDSEELAEQLKELFSNFPFNQEYLANFRKNLEKFQKNRWDGSWNETVLPLLTA